MDTAFRVAVRAALHTEHHGATRIDYEHSRNTTTCDNMGAGGLTLASESVATDAEDGGLPRGFLEPGSGGVRQGVAHASSRHRSSQHPTNTFDTHLHCERWRFPSPPLPAHRAVLTLARQYAQPDEQQAPSQRENGSCERNTRRHESYVEWQAIVGLSRGYWAT